VTDKERRTPQCRSVSSLPRHTTQRQRMSVRDRQSRTGRLSADAVVIYLALLVLVESFSCPLAVGFLKYYGSFQTLFSMAAGRKRCRCRTDCCLSVHDLWEYYCVCMLPVFLTHRNDFFASVCAVFDSGLRTKLLAGATLLSLLSIPFVFVRSDVLYRISHITPLWMYLSICHNTVYYSVFF